MPTGCRKDPTSFRVRSSLGIPGFPSRLEAMFFFFLLKRSELALHSIRQAPLLVQSWGQWGGMEEGGLSILSVCVTMWVRHQIPAATELLESGTLWKTQCEIQQWLHLKEKSCLVFSSPAAVRSGCIAYLWVCISNSFVRGQGRKWAMKA